MKLSSLLLKFFLIFFVKIDIQSSVLEKIISVPRTLCVALGEHYKKSNKLYKFLYLSYPPLNLYIINKNYGQRNFLDKNKYLLFSFPVLLYLLDKINPNYQTADLQKILKKDNKYFSPKLKYVNSISFNISSMPFKKVREVAKKYNEKLNFKTLEEIIFFIKNKKNFNKFVNIEKIIFEKIKNQHMLKMKKSFNFYSWKENFEKKLILQKDIEYLRDFYTVYLEGISFLTDNKYFSKSNLDQYIKHLEKAFDFEKNLYQPNTLFSFNFSYEKFIELLNKDTINSFEFLEKHNFVLKSIFILFKIFSKIKLESFFYVPYFTSQKSFRNFDLLIYDLHINLFLKYAFFSLNSVPKEVFQSYNDMPKSSKSLLPDFKENYDKDNKEFYRDWMKLIILTAVKKKINEKKKEKVYISYDDCPKEYDFFNELVKNCKVFCPDNCDKEMGRCCCTLKDYLKFGFVDSFDINFFDDELIFDKKDIMPSGNVRRIVGLGKYQISRHDNLEDMKVLIKSSCIDYIDKKIEDYTEKLKKSRGTVLKRVQSFFLLF